jgi:hypothetical protein
MNLRTMLIYGMPFLATALVSCANSSNDAESDELTGSIMLGAVNGATVDLYELNSDGSVGDKLDSCLSDQTGQYRFQNRHRFHGAKLVVAHGGAYVDEATGETVALPEDVELASVVSDISSESVVSVNALTAMIANRVLAANSGDITQARIQVQAQVRTMFGLSDVDLISTTPDDLTSEDGARYANQNRYQSRYGMIIASLSQLGKDQSLNAQETLKLMVNMIEDYSDGTLDGSNDGLALSYNLAVEPLQAMQAFGQAVENFGVCERNRTQLRAGDFSFSFGQLPE